MTNPRMVRVAAIAAVVFSAAASPLFAQGAAPKQVVVSPSALKAMTVQKTRSKTPMTARVGMKRAKSLPVTGARKRGPEAPTWVRELRPKVKKK